MKNELDLRKEADELVRAKKEKVYLDKIAYLKCNVEEKKKEIEMLERMIQGETIEECFATFVKNGNRLGKNIMETL